MSALTADDLDALLRLLEGRNLARFDYDDEDVVLRLQFAPRFAASPRQGETAAISRSGTSRKPSEGSVIASPCVGVFRAAHPFDARPVLSSERIVQAGTAVAFVEAGPLLHPVVAPSEGRLGECLVADGSAVAFGTALYSIG